MIDDATAAAIRAKVEAAERRVRAAELAAKYKRKGGWRCTGEMCKATAQTGEPCTLWAYPDGYCPTHSTEGRRP